MPASQNFVLAKGKNAASAITKKRFVKLVADGTDSVEMCDTGGERAYGVALFSVSTSEIAKGKLASVLNEGRAIVEASEAITAGAEVTTDADGKAAIAGGGDVVNGICDEPAGADGDECSVLLK